MLARAIPPEQQCHIDLHFDTGRDKRHQQAPDASVRKIVVICQVMVIRSEAHRKNIILYHHSGQPLHHIADTHPLYPSLCYVLLFLTGQIGWHLNILYKMGSISMSPWLSTIATSSSSTP